MKWTKRHSQNAVAAKARRRLAQKESVPGNESPGRVFRPCSATNCDKKDFGLQTISKALSLTPSEISEKWVKREVLEKCEHALADVLNHRSSDPNGNHVWWVGETSFLICESALNAARTELGKDK